MVRIDIGTEAEDLRIDVGIARQRRLALLQQQHSRALGHHKAITQTIIRTRGPFRLLVTCAERAENGKDVDAYRANGRICPSGQHAIGISLSNRSEEHTSELQ